MHPSQPGWIHDCSTRWRPRDHGALHAPGRGGRGRLRGEHVAVVTPAASGKTLCYNLPVLHRLLADPRARALYLFPTKALAQDQLAELRGLIELLVDKETGDRSAE